MKSILRSILKFLLMPITKNKRLYFYFQENFFTGTADFLYRLKMHTDQYPSKGIIIDVGAANGDVSNFFLKNYPQAEKVIAFEPNAKMLPFLNQIKDPRFTLVKKGLGEQPGVLTLNVTTNNLSSSFYDIDVNEAKGHLKEALEVTSTAEVEITTLDDFVNPEDQVQILKMDTQGSELDILKGAINTLKRTHFVVSEVQNHNVYAGACQYYDIDAFMRAQNFEMVDIVVYYRNPEKKVDEFDVIYKNKSL